MDVQHLLDWAFTLLLAIGGFVMKSLHIKVEETRKDLSTHKETVAKEYVTKEDITTRFEKMENRLDDIYKLLVNRDRA